MKIDERTRKEILQDWTSGLSYRELSSKHDVATGTVSNIISEYRQKVPDLNELRMLSLQLKESEVSLADILHNITIVEKLNEIDIGTGRLEKFIDLCNSLNAGEVDPATIIDCALRFRDIEQTLDMPVKEALTEIEECTSQLPKLQSKVQRLRNLEEASDFLKWLQSCNISYHDLIDHAVSVEDLERQRKPLRQELEKLRRQVLAEKRTLRMAGELLQILMRQINSAQAYLPRQY